MVYQNISTLLLELAAINNENTIEYTGNIKINCLEINNNLIPLLLGSGIGWFLIGNILIKNIKKYCFKRNTVDDDILLMASHVSINDAS
jgi:hypothetical protein